MSDEERVPINPLHFFHFGADCRYLKTFDKKGFPSLDAKTSADYELPSTQLISGEKAKATVALGWHPEGLEAFIQVEADDELHPVYPELTRGDSVELFFDTRDVKTSGYNTRYCHHFFFLPEAVEGIVAGERTRFRTDDAHPLCDPADLKVVSKPTFSGYILQIFIPSQCLYGYDPEQFDRLGFNYRINKFGKNPEEFSSLTEDFQVEQQPSLWSSLKLIR